MSRWKCVNAHDRCFGGTAAGPECQYCERIERKNTGARYANDRIYADYSFVDETSSTDPFGRWDGSDSYIRTYRCRVPRKMLERSTMSGDNHEIMAWLEKHEGDATRGVWK